MKVRFVKNPSFEREMRRDPELVAGMNRIARGVASEAKALSPHETGYFRRSLRAAGSIVLTNDPFGHLVEWGSKNNVAYAPLRRAVRAAGLRLQTLSK